MFVTIEPGQSVTASVNAAQSYKLAGISTAQVTAIQGFAYVAGTSAPTTLSELQLCDDVTSSTVTITPDQSKVAT